MKAKWDINVNKIDICSYIADVDLISVARMTVATTLECLFASVNLISVENCGSGQYQYQYRYHFITHLTYYYRCRHNFKPVGRSLFVNWFDGTVKLYHSHTRHHLFNWRQCLRLIFDMTYIVRNNSVVQFIWIPLNGQSTYNCQQRTMNT